LFLIGIIALMFLGPRKLPQIAKTIGKTLADFRNTTNEFKATWQREVDFEEDIRAIRTGELAEDTTTTIPRGAAPEIEANTIAAPSIKPAQAELFAESLPENQSETAPETETETTVADDMSDKRNWL
jgi:sec-independent protein translocase protein TatB